jgi:hypothetical protein
MPSDLDGENRGDDGEHPGQGCHSASGDPTQDAELLDQGAGAGWCATEVHSPEEFLGPPFASQQHPDGQDHEPDQTHQKSVAAMRHHTGRQGLGLAVAVGGRG